MLPVSWNFASLDMKGKGSVTDTVKDSLPQTVGQMVRLLPQATRDGRLRRRVWVPFGAADLFVVVGDGEKAARDAVLRFPGGKASVGFIL